MSKKIVLTALLLNMFVSLWSATVCAAELRIAIFPFSVHTQDDISYIRDGITSLLPSRIAVSGRLAVIDSFLVRSEINRLPAEHPLTADVALGKKLNADYILIGSITKIGANVSLDTRLINTAAADDVTPFFIQSIGLNDMLPQLTAFGARVRQKILGGPETEAAPAAGSSSPAQVQTARPAAPGEEPARDETLEAPLEAEYQTVVRPPSEKGPPVFEAQPFYSLDIAGESLHCMAAADVDGDGTRELLLSGESRILIYQWAEGGLRQSGEIKAGIGEHLVHIDTADTNKNRQEEIFVSSFEKSAPNSFVLESKQGSFSRSAKSQPWFFRIYQPPGKRLMIMGQNAGETSPFGNVIYTFSWNNGALEARNEFLIPESLQLYSFVQADIDGDGSLEYIAYNKGILSYQYQLTIFSSLGRMRWRDQHLKLGGEVNYFIKRIFANDIEQKDYLPMRILCDDYNRDGRLDIVTGRNSTKGNIVTEKISRQYNQGEVCCLNWDGYGLSQNWSSGLMDGYVADYGVFSLDGDEGNEIFILSVSESGLLKREKTRLSVFKQATAPH